MYDYRNREFLLSQKLYIYLETHLSFFHLAQGIAVTIVNITLYQMRISHLTVVAGIKKLRFQYSVEFIPFRWTQFHEKIVLTKKRCNFFRMG